MTPVSPETSRPNHTWKPSAVGIQRLVLWVVITLLFGNSDAHDRGIASGHFGRTDAEDAIERLLRRLPITIENVTRNSPRDFAEQVARTIFEDRCFNAGLLQTMPKP